VTTLSITQGDLDDPRVVRLLADHLPDMFATSPAESVHALDVSGLSVRLGMGLLWSPTSSSDETMWQLMPSLTSRRLLGGNGARNARLRPGRLCR
jgi:hypothetical protein